MCMLTSGARNPRTQAWRVVGWPDVTAALNLGSVQAEHPLNYLTIEGRGCKVFRSNEHYNAVEKEEGLIAWNGQHDTTIDRFDGRSLLDFYREPDPAVLRRNAANKTAQEMKLEDVRAHACMVAWPKGALHATCTQCVPQSCR